MTLQYQKLFWIKRPIGLRRERWWLCWALMEVALEGLFQEFYWAFLNPSFRYFTNHSHLFFFILFYNFCVSMVCLGIGWAQCKNRKLFWHSCRDKYRWASHCHAYSSRQGEPTHVCCEGHHQLLFRALPQDFFPEQVNLNGITKNQRTFSFSFHHF